MNPFLTPFPEPAPEIEIEVDVEPAGAIEPSAQDLIERARSAPPRPMWQSLHATPDPVLQAKARPRVAERREKLTHLVKASLIGCAILCAAAIVAGAIGGTSTAAAAGAAHTPRAVVIDKEGMEQVTVTKGHAHASAHVTPAHAKKARAKSSAKPRGKKAKSRRARR